MNQSLALGLVLSLVDRISSPLKAIERAQDSYNKSLGRMDAGLLKTSRSFEVFSRSLGKAGAPYLKVIDQANMMTQLGQKMVIRGAAGMAIGLAPTIDAAGIEEAMAEVATLTDKSVDEFKAKYQRDVMDLSAELNQAPEAVIKGMYQAISAGVKEEEIIAFMRSQGKAARAGVSDIFTSVDLATTIKNAYQLPMEKMAQVNDMIFQTVRKGKTTFPEIARNFSVVGAQAAGAGISLEHVQASIAQLTLGGVKTERAYTSLRYVIDALAAPGNDAKKIFQELGIEMNAEVLRKNDLVGSLDLITQKMKGMSEAARAEALSKIFGSQEAMLFVNDFMAKADQYKGMVGEMKNSAGASNDAYNKMAQTTSHYWGQLLKTLKYVSVALGSSLLPAVNVVLKVVKAILLPIAHFADSHKILTGLVFGSVIGFFSLVTALGVLAMTFGTVTKAATYYRIAMALITTQKGRVLASVNGMTSGLLANVKGMGAGIVSMFPRILSVAGSALGRLAPLFRGAFVTGPWGWVALGLTGVFLLIRKFAGPLQAFFGGVWAGMKAAFAPMVTYFMPLITGIAALWKWFTALLAPVKAGEKGFQRFAEAGKTVGKVLTIIGTAALILTPLGWLYAALFGIAWLIKRYWFQLGAFFTGFWAGFSEGMVPVKEALNSLQVSLEPLLPLLNQLLDLAVRFGLIDQSTQKLEGWARAGRLAGSAMAFIFKSTPVISFLMVLSRAVDYINKIDFTSAGQNIVRTLYQGIMSMVGLPVRAMEDLAKSLMNPFGSPAMAGGPSTPASGGMSSVTDMLGSMMGGKGVGGGGSRGGGGTAKFGDILINIPGTNASAGDIAKSVQDGIEQALRKAW